MVEGGSIAFLSITLLLGGAGTSYPVVGGLIEALAIGLVVQSGLSSRLLPAPAGATFIFSVSLLILAVPLLQLVPLPPALWLALPGHDLPARILAAAGVPIGWRPLSLDPALTEITMLELLPGLALFWAGLQLREAARLRLVSVVVGVAMVSALLGAMQKVAGGGSPLILFTTAHAENAPGLFVNRNHEACFLLAAMPLLAAVMRVSPFARRFGNFERSAIFLALLGLLGAGALATTSRMGLLLLLPATLTALAIGFGAQRRRGYLLGVLAIAAIVAALVTFSSTFDVAVGRLGTDEDSRTLFWAATREAIVKFWPIGSGIGTFARVYPTVEHLDTLDASFPYNAHDDYLELLLEGGAPALLLMLAVGGFLILSMVHLLRRSRLADVSLGLGAGCSLVLILLHSIVDYPLRMMSIMGLFGLLTGVLARAAVSTVERQEARSAGSGTVGDPRAARSRHILAKSVVIVPLALLGLFCVVTTTGAQTAFLANDYAGAARLAPRWSDASATLAQQRLRERKLVEAKGLALNATASSPLDPEGPTAAALIDQAQGETVDADRMLDALPQLGWRHAPLQYLLAFRAADRGDLASAIPRVDALLRQGLFKAQFVPFLRAATAYSDGLDALSHQLSFDPKWRKDYLRNLADLQPADFAGHEALLTLLRRSKHPTTPTEINAYLQQRVRAGDYRAAAAASDRLLGSTTIGNEIHDPSFRSFARGLELAGPFDWQLVEGTEARLEASPNGLHISTSGPAAGTVLRQILTAPPGQYRLMFQTVPREAATHQDLRWALRCLGGTYLQAEQRDAAQTVDPLRFVIPGDNCMAQQLELTVDHRSGDSLEIILSHVSLLR